MSAAGFASSWDPNSLLEVDLILPEQLDDANAAAWTGEFGLLWTVFSDGMQTFCREIMRGQTSSLTYREVERWIFRPSSDAIAAFSNLCEFFQIDPRRTRRALMRLRDHPSEGVRNLLSVDAA